VKMLIRFVILFVNFILGGVAVFSFLIAFFRTLSATFGFVIPVVLFVLIEYIDRGHRIGNFLCFLVGGVAVFAFLLYALFQMFAGIPGTSGM